MWIEFLPQKSTTRKGHKDVRLWIAGKEWHLLLHHVRDFACPLIRERFDESHVVDTCLQAASYGCVLASLFLM